MGLFRKLTGKSSQPQQSGSQQHYAPPLGPPPPQNRPISHQMPPQQYAPPPGPPQQYAPPPGPPPTGPTTSEDPFAGLRRFDSSFLIDDSESMEMEQPAFGNKPLWDIARDALIAAVDVATKYDADGVDIAFFNNPTVASNINNASSVRQLFTRVYPNKSTPTADALRRVLEPYITRVEAASQPGQSRNRPKPLNLIVLTDGAPNRGQEPDRVIVEMARRLDAVRAPPYQLGIQFLQIGDDEEATEALKNLDDNLKTEFEVRDMVDTTPYQKGRNDTDFLVKALLGGVNKKLDAQG